MKKDILFIISSIEKLGGSERVATSIANELCNEFNVSFISRGNINKKIPYEIDASINDIRFQGNQLLFLKFIKKYVKKSDPDIVVIHTMSKLTPLLLLSGIKARSLWSLEHTSYEFHPLSFKLLRSLFYNRLDKVLVLTQSQKDIYDKLNKNLNTTVIPNPSPFPIANSKYNVSSKTIVSIGSLEHHKGFDLLISSWAKIHKNHPDWTLHIYGEGTEKQKLMLQVEGLGIDNIEFKGITTDVCQVYDNSSFYVLSSRYEGLPMVLIEAQARGLPLISFECQSGPAEIIENGTNGILIPSEDTNELAKAIELFINNPDTRSRMSENSKLLSEKFLISSIIKIWKSLINT